MQALVGRKFPIVRGWLHMSVDRLTWLPWEMMAPHEQQAQKNHGQTLTRLAERGGLCPMEAVAVLEDADYRARWPHRSITREKGHDLSMQAFDRLDELYAVWVKANHDSATPVV